MRDFGLFCFNVLVAVGGATVYAWAVRWDGMTEEAWRRALIEGGSAGFLSGAIVGLGATLGPRPSLPVKKCLVAHVGNAVTSLIGGLVAYYFPRIYSQVNFTIDEALAERGILRGSGIGLAIGSLWHFFQIYFKRRKPSR